MKELEQGSDVIISVHPSKISQMTGQKRANIEALCRKAEACEDIPYGQLGFGGIGVPELVENGIR